MYFFLDVTLKLATLAICSDFGRMLHVVVAQDQPPEIPTPRSANESDWRYSFPLAVTESPPTTVHSVSTVTQFERADEAVLVDKRRHCTLTSKPKGSGGALIAGLFQLHGEYSEETDHCVRFLGWDGVEQTESFLYAKREISQNLVDWSLFGMESGDTVFGYELRDTCSSSVLGTAQAQDLASDSAVYRAVSIHWLRRRLGWSAFNKMLNSLGPKVRASLSSSCHGPPQLLAVIGPASSAEVAAISPLLTVFEIPHISHWATSTTFNNVGKYPYLFRTVPSDEHQVRAMVDVIEYFGWKYIAVIGDDDELYSGRGVEMLHQESSRRGTFCIGLFQRISVRDKVGIRRTAARLKADKQAVVVILFMLLKPAEAFLDAMSEEKENVTGKIIIGSDDWVNRIRPSFQDNNYDLASLASKLAVFGFKPRTPPTPLIKGWKEELNPLKLLSHQRLSSNPWLKPYLEQILDCKLPPVIVDTPCDMFDTTEGSGHTPCHSYGKDIKIDLPTSTRAEPLIFALELSARAILHSFFMNHTGQTFSASDFNHKVQSWLNDSDCDYPPGGLIRDALRQLTVPCTTGDGQCHVFDKNQAAYPAYHVVNWQDRAGEYNMAVVGKWDGKAAKRLQWSSEAILSFGPMGECHGNTCQTSRPVSTCSRPCMPGERRFFHNTLLAQCCWKCHRCSETSVSNTTNSDNCKVCHHGYRPNRNRRVCERIPPTNLKMSDPWVVIIYVASIGGATLTLLTLGIFICFRHLSLVRSMDFSLTSIILVSATVNHLITPFTIGVGELTDRKCQANMILGSPWKIIVMATVLVKTNRFLLIFKAATLLRGSHRLLLMSTPVQIAVVLSITIIVWLPMPVYVFILPVKAVLTYPTNHTAQVTCSADKIWLSVMGAIFFSLIVTTVVMAFQTRKLPENYNEARQVYFASSTTLVVWLGLTPATFITSSHLQPAITGLASEFQMWAIWCCLYLPRVIVLFRNKAVRSADRQCTFKTIQSLPGCIQRPLFRSTSVDLDADSKDNMTEMSLDLDPPTTFVVAESTKA